LSADEVTRLITAIASLVGALAWPALVLLVLVRFRVQLGEFFANLEEARVKGPGFEASARRRELAVAAALGAADAKSATGTVSRGPSDPGVVAATLTDALPDARAHRRLEGCLVLWVDDHPDNNHYERQALEALGVRFVIATSTDAALQQLTHQSVDLIISDMGRPEGRQAGYDLLDALRTQGIHTPFMIYAGSRDPKQVEEARQRGALGSTNSPQELFTIVTASLASRTRT
jgi:CheY-like chemotaxis protein